MKFKMSGGPELWEERSPLSPFIEKVGLVMKDTIWVQFMLGCYDVTYCILYATRFIYSIRYSISIDVNVKYLRSLLFHCYSVRRSNWIKFFFRPISLLNLETGGRRRLKLIPNLNVPFLRLHKTIKRLIRGERLNKKRGLLAFTLLFIPWG
jgi:hypothetical protein